MGKMRILFQHHQRRIKGFKQFIFQRDHFYPIGGTGHRQHKDVQLIRFFGKFHREKTCKKKTCGGGVLPPPPQGPGGGEGGPSAQLPPVGGEGRPAD